MNKFFIIIGIIFLIIGIAWPLIIKLGLGKLPGDIIFKKGGVTFYFPIVTCIIISVIISLVLWFINR